MHKSTDLPDLPLLRALDAAPPVELDDTGRRRARAKLHQILATDPVRPGPGSVPRRWPRAVRWAAVPAAAVVAATWVAPALLGADPAYASWTPAPQEITAADRAVADAACRDADLRLDPPSLDLAERRGEWVGLLYTGTHVEGGPAAATCMVYLPIGDQKADEVDIAVGGGQGAVPVDGQFTQGPISEYGGPNPWPFGRQDRPVVSFTHGELGDDVVAVTIHTADGQAVEATVDGGRYAAWWPGRALEPHIQSSGVLRLDPSFNYSITLRDGTVVENAQPTMPR